MRVGKYKCFSYVFVDVMDHRRGHGTRSLYISNFMCHFVSFRNAVDEVLLVFEHT